MWLREGEGGGARRMSLSRRNDWLCEGKDGWVLFMGEYDVEGDGRSYLQESNAS